MEMVDRIGRTEVLSRGLARVHMRASGLVDGVAPTHVEGVYTAKEHPLDCKCAPCVNGDPFYEFNWEGGIE